MNKYNYNYKYSFQPERCPLCLNCLYHSISDGRVYCHQNFVHACTRREISIADEYRITYEYSIFNVPFLYRIFFGNKINSCDSSFSKGFYEREKAKKRAYEKYVRNQIEKGWWF